MSETSEMDVQTDRVNALICSQCNTTLDISACAPLMSINCSHCGAPQTVPARFGPFLLLKLLGRGGMGSVFHAYDESLNRFVAIKVMQRKLGQDEAFVASFQKEAQAAAGLNHPNVVQIYSFGQEKGQPYIVMELVSGGKFNAMIEARGPMEQGRVMRIARDIAAGLQAASHDGLLHGDVKPENILIDDKGTAKLVDFGLASAVGRQHGDAVWGTPNYIAPEKVRRLKVDERSDIYSLGATLFHGLAGRPPFTGVNAIAVVKARLTDPPPKLRDLRQDIHEEVERVIGRMLESDPTRRYPTYASLLTDIDSVLNSMSRADDDNGRLSRPKGRITIRKKGQSAPSASEAPLTANSAAAAPSSGAGAPPATRDGPRLILARKDGTALSLSAPARTTADAGAATESRRRKKRRSSVVAVTLLVLLAAAAMAGLGVAVSSHRRNSEAGRQRARARLAIDTAVKELGVIAAVCATREARMAEIRHDADKCTNQIVRAAAAMLPPDLLELYTAPPPSPPPPSPPPAVGTNTPAAGLNPGPAGGAGGATNAAAPRDAAATLSTNAAPKQATAPPPPSPEAPATAPEVAAEPDAPPSLLTITDRGDVVAALTNALLNCRRLDDNCRLFAELSAETRASQAAGASNSAAVARSADTARVLDAQTRVTNLVTRARQTTEESAVPMQAAEASLAALHAGRETLQRILTAGEQSLAETTEKRKRAEQTRQREEEARRLKEELRTRALAERRQVRQLRTDQKPSLDAYDFAAALRALQNGLDALHTDEARAELDILIRRYKLLCDLKTFLSKSINEKPCEWCWERTRSDIVAASPQGLKIRNVPGVVPWDTVSAREFLTIVRYYFTKDRVQISLRELARMQLAAGVLSAEHDAQPGADAFGKKAIELWDAERFKEEVQTLLAPLPDVDAP